MNAPISMAGYVIEPQPVPTLPVQGSDKLFAAIKTIIVADLVMSVDNVIAIAGAAQNAGEHSFLLVVLGLLISIPIIVWGSTLVIKLKRPDATTLPLFASTGALGFHESLRAEFPAGLFELF